MSIEEYEKLSEERPDLLKIIDGNVYYSFDYTDYLYNELQKKDNIINELEKYCEKERSNSQFVHECNAYNDVLMKLKDLKED